MRYGEVSDRFYAGRIHEVVVVRRLKQGVQRTSPRQTEREADSRYLLIFVPTPKLPRPPKAEDYLLYRDRAGERHRIRYFGGLFTVSQTIKKWGMERFIYLDVARKSEQDAIRDIVKAVSATKGPYAPLKEFFEDYGLDREAND